MSVRFEVNERNFYRRLDRFLRRSLPSVPLSAIYKFIRKGKVFVNGKRTRKVDHELSIGDVVELRYVDLEKYEKDKKELVPQKMDLEVIYEDERVLAINKPPGIALHPGRGIHVATLIEGLMYYGNERGFEPHLVHRLDLNTSGVLLVAKDKETARILTDLFKRRLVKKEYMVLVKGKVSRSGKVEKTLDGQFALTEYEPIRRFKDSTLLKVRIKTGRKHQIRRHMAEIGHPVVGDERYGDRIFNSVFKKEFGLKRQFLHCTFMELPHPFKDEILRIEADLSDDLKKVLSRLGL